MNPRPTIGIPTQTLQSIDGIPEGLPASWVMNQRYYIATAALGGVPWMIPLLDDEATLRCIYEQLDGLFLAGGVDMDPATYGAEPHPALGRIDPARDCVETTLTRRAMDDGKPTFGVCRGMQVINVAAGGTLLQDVAAQHPGAIKHDYFPNQGFARNHLSHTVRIAPGSRLSRSVGAVEARVNSMHHQGVERLGEGLVPVAWAPDGLVEALEGSGDGFLVGAQWHPEMLTDSDPPTRRLFVQFIQAASDWKRSGALVPA